MLYKSISHQTTRISFYCKTCSCSFDEISFSRVAFQLLAQWNYSTVWFAVYSIFFGLTIRYIQRYVPSTDIIVQIPWLCAMAMVIRTSFLHFNRKPIYALTMNVHCSLVICGGYLIVGVYAIYRKQKHIG